MVPPVETRQRHVSILFKHANGRFKHPIITRQRHVSIFKEANGRFKHPIIMRQRHVSNNESPLTVLRHFNTPSFNMENGVFECQDVFCYK